VKRKKYGFDSDDDRCCFRSLNLDVQLKVRVALLVDRKEQVDSRFGPRSNEDVLLLMTEKRSYPNHQKQRLILFLMLLLLKLQDELNVGKKKRGCCYMKSGNSTRGKVEGLAFLMVEMMTVCVRESLDLVRRYIGNKR
jgi:hypothetical protein